jgi:hypothetical protein
VNFTFTQYSKGKGKGEGKAIPLQAWTGFQKDEAPRFQNNQHMKVVSPTHWPPLPPGNIPGTHFC